MSNAAGVSPGAHNHISSSMNFNQNMHSNIKKTIRGGSRQSVYNRERSATLTGSMDIGYVNRLLDPSMGGQNPQNMTTT